MSRLNELFPVGPPLSEELQIGRRASIDGLEERARDGEKMKLLEPRRTGKSSAAGAVTDRLRSAGLPAAEVDLATRNSPAEVAVVLRAQLSPGLAALAAAKDATGWLARRVAEGLGGEDRLVAGVIADHRGGSRRFSRSRSRASGSGRRRPTHRGGTRRGAPPQVVACA